jgi:hypothetical protein
MVLDQVYLSVSAARTRMNRNSSRHLVSTSHVFRLGMMLGIAATALLLASGQVLATDNYLIKPMKLAFDDPATMRRMNSAAKKYAYAESIKDFADEDYARVYYQEYLPARITQSENRDEISALMTDVRNRMTRAYRAGTPGAKNLTRWLYSGMRPIADGNYHPAARINAILLIARIDVVPGDPSTRRPPVPSPVIPHVLFPLYKNAANSDGVRAAALSGLRRYVNLAGPVLKKPQQDALISEMQTLIEQSPPKGRNVLAHAYLQRFAVDILASLIPWVPSDGQKQFVNNGLGAYLVGLSTDETKHQLLAMHAASRLAPVDKKLRIADGRVQKILLGWSSLATDALDREIKRLEAMTRPEPVSPQPVSAQSIVQLSQAAGRRPGNVPMQGQMGGDEMDESIGVPLDGDDMENPQGMPAGWGRTRLGRGGRPIQPPEVMMSRRKLNFVLQQFHLGVAGSRKMRLPGVPRGLMAAVTDSDRKVVRDWAIQLHQASSGINQATLFTRMQYVEELKAQLATFEKVRQAFTIPPPVAKPGSLPVDSLPVNNESMKAAKPDQA